MSPGAKNPRGQVSRKRESAARAEEERDAAPAMPIKQCVDEPHRVKAATLYWEKLGEISELQYALVARVVNQAEIDRTPAAKQAMDKEWQKLVDKSCWLHSKVREFRDVSAEAIRKGIKTHFGRIFEICSIKGDELPEGHPDRKWKGRSVFQGNRVSDEHNDHAIFSELGSSPASMEAAKVIDVFGSQPGYSKQQADAKQAYTQALFKGVETWVRLPRNRWPKEGRVFKIRLFLFCWLFTVIPIQVEYGKSTVRINLRLWAGHPCFRRSGNQFSIMPNLIFCS